MAASKTERLAYLWHIDPHSVPNQADENVDLIEILELLQEAYEAKEARVYISSTGRILDNEADVDDIDPKNQLYIAEIKRTERTNTVSILINRGDPDTVSPAFIDSEKYDVRIERPKEKEAPGWSAHLVISLGKERGGHRACFEKMPKVSTSLALACLDRIISKRAARKGTYIWTRAFRRGKQIIRETKTYRPVLGVKKLPSETLENDLKNGILSSVTLTKVKLFYDGVGANDVVRKQEEKIVLKTQPADQGRIKRFIKAITDKAKEEGYESISFSVEDLPGGRTTTPTISLETEDALDTLYVRAQRITDFSEILEACYARICPQIEEKLVQIILSDNFAGHP